MGLLSQSHGTALKVMRLLSQNHGTFLSESWDCSLKVMRLLSQSLMGLLSQSHETALLSKSWDCSLKVMGTSFSKSWDFSLKVMGLISQNHGLLSQSHGTFFSKSSSFKVMGLLSQSHGTDLSKSWDFFFKVMALLSYSHGTAFPKSRDCSLRKWNAFTYVKRLVSSSVRHEHSKFQPVEKYIDPANCLASIWRLEILHGFISDVIKYCNQIKTNAERVKLCHLPLRVNFELFCRLWVYISVIQLHKRIDVMLSVVLFIFYIAG